MEFVYSTAILNNNNLSTITLDPNHCGNNCCAGFFLYKGRCTECYEGTVGINCTEICPEGFYGRQCRQECPQECMGKCNKVNGTCLDIKQKMKTESIEVIKTRPNADITVEDWNNSLTYLSGLFTLQIIITISVFGIFVMTSYTIYKVRLIGKRILKDKKIAYKPSFTSADYKVEQGRIALNTRLSVESAQKRHTIGNDFNYLPEAHEQREQYLDVV